MITEAGGLIGNFTGESDYLYQREVVAGNPKVYGQLVSILTPYTRVIKDEPAGDTAGVAAASAAEAPDATAAFVQAATQPARKAPLRVRKAATPDADDAPM
jgi:myo-inositol-1(or 4)-monophosphatase